MELTQIIKERRSIHRFQEREVPLGLVKELLDTAVWVPNHKMTQPWRFVIVHGEGRKRIAEIATKLKSKRAESSEKAKEIVKKVYEKMMSVPMFVVVIMKEHPVISTREEDYASTSCLIHNFSLLAWERGVGMVWESYGLMHEPDFREALGIQPGEKVVGSLHVGYPENIPAPKPRKSATELITFIDQA